MSNRWSRCLKPTTVKTVRWWNEAERAFPVLLSSLRSIEKREHQSFCLSATIKKRQTCGGQKKRVRSEIYFLRSLQFKYITNKRRWCEIFTERTFKYSFAWYLRSDLGKQWDKNASIDSSTSVVIIIISFKTSRNDYWSLSFIYIEILREIRHFTILISESDRINFKRIVARISREIRNSKSFRCSTMSLFDDNWSAESVLVTQPIDANERMSFALCSIKIRARTENPEKLARPCRSYDWWSFGFVSRIL